MGSGSSIDIKHSKVHVETCTNEIIIDPTNRSDITYVSDNTYGQVQNYNRTNIQTHAQSQIDSRIKSIQLTGIELNISNKGKGGKISFRKYQNLLYIDCSNNLIDNIIYFPPTLQHINCSHNRLTKLILPPNIQTVICSYNQITVISMGKSYENLYEIDCSHNRIETLDDLPENLVKLNCSSNNIRFLNNLPKYLDQLDCSNNFITVLINLPKFLKKLNCSFNMLKILENIPLCIEEIYCTDNMICSISTESSYKLEFLRVLCCGNNHIREIDFLIFPSLEIVDCSHNSLKELKDLPLGLTHAICNDNMIKFVSDINGHIPDCLEYFCDGFEHETVSKINMC